MQNIIKEIDRYINDMKIMGYDMDKLILVLKKPIFRKNTYEYRGISIIYDDSIKNTFEFKEARRKYNSYWM